MSIRQIISLKIHQLRQGIANLIIWFPIIWNDRQWDYSFFYKMLIKKLELKEEFFLSRKAYGESSNEIAAQIKEMKEAIQRLYENDYLSAGEFLDHENALIKYKEWALAEEELVKKDLETVANSFKNNIRNWWD